MTGQKADESDIDGSFTSNELTINFSDNKLDGHANDIDYGKLKYSSVGKPVTGTINGEESADIFSISDNRRQKNQSKIYLQQTRKFLSAAGDELHGELRYYSPDGTYQVLDSAQALISDTPAGNTVGSIGNSNTTGLKLFIFDSLIKNADYSSTLNWTIESAP